MNNQNNTLEWNNQTKYYVVGSDGSIAMGPTTVKQIAISHAASMNRTNSEDDMRLWRVISRDPSLPLLKVNTI